MLQQARGLIGAQPAKIDHVASPDAALLLEELEDELLLSELVEAYLKRHGGVGPI